MFIRRVTWVAGATLLCVVIGFESARSRRSPFQDTLPLTAAFISSADSRIASRDTLRDRARLDSLLTMLRAGRWTKSWHTLPSGSYTVEMVHDTETVAAIHVCSDCIVGVRYDARSSGGLLRSMTETEGAALARWFAVPWPLSEKTSR